MPQMEFQEIAQTGGTISFNFEPGRGISVGIRHANPWRAAIHQVCVSLDGKILDFVSAGGIGSVVPYPQPSILVLLLSDREGLYGRCCPACTSYFRSSFLSSITFCPYCGHEDQGVEFFTENQIHYITAYCNAFIDAYENEKSVEVDLDELIASLEKNKPGWVYVEESQQSKHACEKCKCVFDILGDYGICPTCALPNFKAVVAEHFSVFEKQFVAADENITDRHEREVEWEKLTRCVSEFESLANIVRKHLLNIPQLPKRKRELAAISFQRITDAAGELERWFGIDLFLGLAAEDKLFLNKMFNRRHVFTHNGGRVDQQYIDVTGDTTVRVNQVIRFKSNEISRLIPLVKMCANNLINGFLEIE